MSKDIIPAMPVFPLMTAEQIDTYYQRLGLQGADRTPSYENLCQLHERQLQVIPFENLDFLNGIITDLSLEGIFNKIIRQKRGGLCSENNGMFAWLLRSLGYQVTTFTARLTNADNPFQPRRHCINCVTLDGKRYLCDVGVARENFRRPILLEEDIEQRSGMGTYKLVKHEFFGWLLLQRLCEDGDFEGYYGFTEEPQWPFDFDYIIGFSETHPHSEDNKGNFVALLTEDGCNNMVGNDYWTFANGVKCDQATLTSYDDLQRVLEQKFNIQFVPNEEYRQRNPL